MLPGREFHRPSRHAVPRFAVSEVLSFLPSCVGRSIPTSPFVEGDPVSSARSFMPATGALRTETTGRLPSFRPEAITVSSSLKRATWAGRRAWEMPARAEGEGMPGGAFSRNIQCLEKGSVMLPPSRGPATGAKPKASRLQGPENGLACEVGTDPRRRQSPSWLEPPRAGSWTGGSREGLVQCRQEHCQDNAC